MPVSGGDRAGGVKRPWWPLADSFAGDWWEQGREVGKVFKGGGSSG